MLKLTLQERLRIKARELRSKPIPLTTLIPLLQDAANEIDELKKEVGALEAKIETIYQDQAGESL